MNANHPRLVVSALLVALSLVASACGSVGDTAVATVGEATLSEEDFEAILEGTGTENTSVVPSETAARHVREWIFFESWIDLVEQGGTELSVLHLESAREEYEAARALDPTVPAAGTRYGRIQQRYRAVPHLIADHMIAVADVSALCSSHLLVETQAEAIAAIARLDAGEDFAALAAEVSIGPSGPTGGDLGCVAPAVFVSEFVDGAAAVGGAGISDPVQSQFGWHVINVRSFGPPVRGRRQEMTSDELTSFVFNNYGAEFQQLQTELFNRDISVDPRFGVFDPNTGQVVSGSPATGAVTGFDSSQN
ncbi:MAG: peptidylprolyl isomerase [Acidimicrobiaceae bacterium]|nr:peptidylprolyl isomerase [Acidimicrobiaceae bacterium]